MDRSVFVNVERIWFIRNEYGYIFECLFLDIEFKIKWYDILKIV